MAAMYTIALKLTFSMLRLQWTPKVVLNAEFYTKSDALEAELEMENVRHILGALVISD